MKPDHFSTQRKAIAIHINGQPVFAAVGDTIAAVLIENGYLNLRQSDKNHPAPRVFCGMGVCFECLVHVGDEEMRACQTLVSEGMQITINRETDD